MGSKKKNKKSKKSTLKRGLIDRLWENYPVVKVKEKRNLIKRLTIQDGKDLKIIEDEKSESINENKTYDNINKNLENFNEQKEIINIEINFKKNDNINNIYEKCLIKNEEIYLS